MRKKWNEQKIRYMENNNRGGQQRVSGMPCPSCQNFIPITMHQLLESNGIFCPACGLRLEINKQSSAKALDALRKVDAAQRNVEATSRFDGR